VLRYCGAGDHSRRASLSELGSWARIPLEAWDLCPLFFRVYVLSCEGSSPPREPSKVSRTGSILTVNWKRPESLIREFRGEKEEEEEKEEKKEKNKEK
jgi:hypothetical protein